MAKFTPPKFGEEALALGFVNTRDVRKGLQIQTYRRARGEPVPLIGEIFVEMGKMTQEQIEETFNSLCSKSTKAKMAKPKKSWWAFLRGA